MSVYVLVRACDVWVCVRVCACLCVCENSHRKEKIIINPVSGCWERLAKVIDDIGQINVWFILCPY